MTSSVRYRVTSALGDVANGYQLHSGLVLLLGDHGLLILTGHTRFHLEATSLPNTTMKYGV